MGLGAEQRMAERRGTLWVNLPGGQMRLRQLVLYIAASCRNAGRFGPAKMNRILWHADFDSFARRGVPITGREYRKLESGPAPREMPLLLREMLMRGQIRVEIATLADGTQERRTVAVAEPDLSLFSAADIAFVDAAIAQYRDLTGTEPRDPALGPAWASRSVGAPMPYELALLDGRTPGAPQLQRLRRFVEDEGIFSQ